MTAFALSTALPAIRRSQFFNEATAIQEPLSGIVDGVRRTFRTQNKPVILDAAGAWGDVSTLTVYDATELLVPASVYAVTSTREGTIQFKQAPTLTGGAFSAPFSASYTWADLDLITLYNALLDGFSEMERRLARGMTLTPIASSTTPIPGLLDVAVTDQSGNDPMGGAGIPFSASATQKSFLALCSLYVLSRNYLFGRSKVAYGYRESRMGMEVNPAAALKAMTDFQKMLSADLDAAMQAAESDWDSGTTGLGASIFAPSSPSYQTMFQWQGSNLNTSPYGGSF